MQSAFSEYITQLNDVLDAVCYAHYGVENMLETVLAFNQGLASYGAVLPAGVIIRLPVLQVNPTPVQAIVSLWD
jgi:phage tail protein X